MTDNILDKINNKTQHIKPLYLVAIGVIFISSVTQFDEIISLILMSINISSPISTLFYTVNSLTILSIIVATYVFKNFIKIHSQKKVLIRMIMFFVLVKILFLLSIVILNYSATNMHPENLAGFGHFSSNYLSELSVNNSIFETLHYIIIVVILVFDKLKINTITA